MSEFVSDLQGVPIIDAEDHPLLQGGARGLMPRDWMRHPFGGMPCAPAFSKPIIPRSEWDERIRDLERSKSRIPDICDDAGLGVKNQGQTNFCWANAPVHCLEIMRVIQGEDAVELSPASVACKINGFRNEGGWGTDAIKYLEIGAVPVSLWPANAIDRKYDTAAADAARKRFQVDEWDDIPPRNFDAMATQLLLGFPCAVGYNWWRHEVTAVALLKLDGTGRYGVLIDNSWGRAWSNNGRGVLTEDKGTPDDCVSPRLVTAG